MRDQTPDSIIHMRFFLGEFFRIPQTGPDDAGDGRCIRQTGIVPAIPASRSLGRDPRTGTGEVKRRSLGNDRAVQISRLVDSVGLIVLDKRGCDPALQNRVGVGV